MCDVYARDNSRAGNFSGSPFFLFLFFDLWRGALFTRQFFEAAPSLSLTLRLEGFTPFSLRRGGEGRWSVFSGTLEEFGQTGWYYYYMCVDEYFFWYFIRGYVSVNRCRYVN